MATTTTTSQRTEEKIVDAEIIETTPNNSERKSEVSNAVQIANMANGIDLGSLTPEQIEKYGRISKSLVPSDINSVANFGSDLKTSVGKYTSACTKTVQLSKMGELGDLMAETMTEIGKVDIDGFRDGSVTSVIRKLPIIGRLMPSLEKRIIKSKTIDEHLATLERKIDASSLLLQRDNNGLNIAFEGCVETMKRLEETIISGRIKLEELKTQLADMLEHRDQYEDYQVQDMQEYINLLDKRLSDLLIQYQGTKMTLPQIRMIQYNNLQLMNNAKSLISTTLPMWRQQFVLAVALENEIKSKNLHEMVRKAHETQMLRNAEMLHETSVGIAKDSQKPIISIEAMRKISQETIDTIKEMKEAEREGAQQRRAACEELLRISEKFSQEMTAEITDSSASFLQLK